MTVDDEVKLFTENQAVYIPLGVVHRLGKVNLHLIQVQSGAYLARTTSSATRTSTTGPEPGCAPAPMGRVPATGGGVA